MDFVTATKVCLTAKYATFSGRALRSEFWFFELFLVLASLIAWVVDDFILENEMGPVGIIVSIATIIPSIAVGARRLHDVDRSGWWQLLAFVPIIGWIVLLVWWCNKSDPLENRFGSPPMAAPVAVGA